jgi:hypothetical protein
MFKLILRTVTSPYDDTTKGSVLSHQELDDNQINLKGELIYTANSENNVITFQKINGGTIQIPFSGSGGGGSGDTYTNLTPTTDTVGGIVQGSTFVSQTMTQMFDALLYPYQFPSFTSFSLGISSPLEIGYEIPVNQTFTWSISNSSNVSPNTVSIAGYNLTTLTGLANDGSQPVTFTNVITRTATDGVGTRSWSIQAMNTKSNTISSSLSISWHWKMYVGTSTNPSLTENGIEALTNYNSVKNGFAGTYAMSAGGYKYFCFATTYGTPTTFVDTLNNLNIGMYGGYSNIDAQGNSYDLVSVTNVNGQTTNYKVYRTLNILSSTITIAVN